MTEAELNAMAFQGMKDLVKWMEAQIKLKKLEVEQARRQQSAMGMFEDCGDFYEHSFTRVTAELAQMVSWKISTEKWMKRLQHEAREKAGG